MRYSPVKEPSRKASKENVTARSPGPCFPVLMLLVMVQVKAKKIMMQGKNLTACEIQKFPTGKKRKTSSRTNVFEGFFVSKKAKASESSYEAPTGAVLADFP